jgi:hypothetical protein
VGKAADIIERIGSRSAASGRGSWFSLLTAAFARAAARWRAVHMRSTPWHLTTLP